MSKLPETELRPARPGAAVCWHHSEAPGQQSGVERVSPLLCLGLVSP